MFNLLEFYDQSFTVEIVKIRRYGSYEYLITSEIVDQHEKNNLASQFIIICSNHIW